MNTNNSYILRYYIKDPLTNTIYSIDYYITGTYATGTDEYSHAGDSQSNGDIFADTKKFIDAIPEKRDKND